jgi:hypothetical protein
MKKPTARIIRLILKLEEYNAKIQYINGVENGAADVMSRLNAPLRFFFIFILSIYIVILVLFFWVAIVSYQT